MKIFLNLYNRLKLKAFIYMQIFLILFYLYSIIFLNPDLSYIILTVLVFNFIIFIFYRKCLKHAIIVFLSILFLLLSLDYIITDKSENAYFNIHIGDSETYLTIFKNLKYYKSYLFGFHSYTIIIDNNIELNCKFNRIFIQNRLETYHFEIPYSMQNKDLIEKLLYDFEINLKFDEVIPAVLGPSIISVNDSTYKNHISKNGKIIVNRYKSDFGDRIGFIIFD